jgi:hypothetical protein
LDIHFTVGTSCERAAPLAKKNAAARHHVLRSLISLHNEHRVALVNGLICRCSLEGAINYTATCKPVETVDVLE